MLSSSDENHRIKNKKNIISIIDWLQEIGYETSPIESRKRPRENDDIISPTSFYSSATKFR